MFIPLKSELEGKAYDQQLPDLSTFNFSIYSASEISLFSIVNLYNASVWARIEGQSLTFFKVSGLWSSLDFAWP